MVFRALVSAVLFGVPGLALTLVGLGYLRTYLRIRRSNPIALRRVGRSTDAVELTGTARTHRTTDVAPFTGTESLLVDWTVRKYSHAGESNWRRVASGVQTNGFLLDDGTGTTLVDPAGANRHLSRSAFLEVGSGEDPPAGIRDFLVAHPDLDPSAGGRRRYEERRLDPGETVHVYGPVRRSGASWDNPDGVDAIVGLENPRRGSASLFVDGISVASILETIRRITGRYVITDAGEAGAGREALRRGALAAFVGLSFVLVPVLVVLFG